MAYNFSTLKQKIQETEDWLRGEFSSIRTGRATPVILDAVSIESYGTRMAINQVASVSTEDSKTLRIVPWDATQVKAIEKGIMDADIGLSVVTDDKGLRVIFPELTGERRASLVKLLKQKHEEARISLRKEREGAKSDIDNKEKEGVVSEDDKFRYFEEMQKMIDEANKKLDELAERKEKEILEN
jgi:ribosome recycling factor